MVLFDPPLGAACALSAENVDEGWGGTELDQIVLTLYDCALAPIEQRKVEAASFTRVDP